MDLGHVFYISLVSLLSLHFEIQTSSAHMEEILLCPLEIYNSRSPKLHLSVKILIINFLPFFF